MFKFIKKCISDIGLIHPKVTFTAAIAGVVAITQNADDYITLFGHGWGPKFYVLAKWFGAFCVAVAAAGRSPLGSIDNPPKGSQ